MKDKCKIYVKNWPKVHLATTRYNTFFLEEK